MWRATLKTYWVDGVIFVLIGIVYGVVVGVYAGTVEPACNRVASNQRLDSANVPAAASSMFLAAPFLSLRFKQWIPTRIYSLVLAVMSFGFWWTQCWHPYHRWDVFLASLITLVVADGIIRNKITSGLMYASLGIYTLIVMLSPNYVVKMEESTAAPAGIALVYLWVVAVFKPSWSHEPLIQHASQIGMSALLLLFAALCLLWSATNDCSIQTWWQPVSVGHFCGGLALYISSWSTDTVSAGTYRLL